MQPVNPDTALLFLECREIVALAKTYVSRHRTAMSQEGSITKLRWDKSQRIRLAPTKPQLNNLDHHILEKGEEKHRLTIRVT